mmetsp:Transcript_56094/g.154578  ORF Transcript_56094/g.154578 Transcript_56094/m.154578 type:complete len:201 (+) Transcript_56094:1726-2328(+)
MPVLTPALEPVPTPTLLPPAPAPTLVPTLALEAVYAPALPSAPVPTPVSALALPPAPTSAPTPTPVSTLAPAPAPLAAPPPHELSYRQLVRVRSPPERGQYATRVPSDIGEVQAPGLNRITGRYRVRLLGHPANEEHAEWSREDLEVCVVYLVGRVRRHHVTRRVVTVTLGARHHPSPTPVLGHPTSGPWRTAEGSGQPA